MADQHRAKVRRSAKPWRAWAPVTLSALSLSLALAPRASAAPAVGLALRAGTPGVGLDLDLGVSRSFGLRVGFSGLNLNHALSTSDVHYSGRLKLRTATALLDWYVFQGGFHLTVGVADNGTRLDVLGQPAQGTYTLDGHTYTSAQLGSLSGEAKFSHAVAPYVGFGWGNPVGKNGRVHLLLDIGAIYGAAPVVTLTALCGSAAPAGSAACTAIENDAVVEQGKLQAKLGAYKWYPIVNLGVSVAF